MFIKISAFAVLAYLVIVVIYAVMQRSFIYYPAALPVDQAKSLAVGQGGEAWLDDQGAWLGWRTGPAEARLRLLVLHGNAGHALHRSYYSELFSQLDQSGPWQVYVLEYPGYGARTDSPDKPGQASFTAAAVSALDHLSATGSSPVVLLGESIGSGVAAQVVSRRPTAVAGLILVTPFSSLATVARQHMPYLPVAVLMRDRFDSLTALKDYRGPMIVLTAGRDQIIPEAHAQPLIDQYRANPQSGPILHLRQPDAGHNSLSFNPESEVWRRVDQFLAENLQSKPYRLQTNSHKDEISRQ